MTRPATRIGPPPHLPILGRYAHLHPEHGACLMEYVALLAGRRLAGQVPKQVDGLGPELEWVRAAAADLGATITSADLVRIEDDWDLTRREALLDPPSSSIAALVALRERGIRLGVLSLNPWTGFSDGLPNVG